MNNVHATICGKAIIVMADRAVVSEAAKIQVRVKTCVISFRRFDQCNVNSALRILGDIASGRGTPGAAANDYNCLLYTSPSPRDA